MNRRQMIEEGNYASDIRVSYTRGWLAQRASAFDGSTAEVDLTDVAEDGNTDLLLALFPEGGKVVLQKETVPKRGLWAYANQVEGLRRLGVAEEQLQEVLTKGVDWVTIPEHEEEVEVYEGPMAFRMPFKYGVCPVCRGKGTHVNPSIDCNGLTAEDFAEDPDFAEDYFSGAYDVQCNGCGGLRVVLVPAVVGECSPAEKLLLAYAEEADREDESYRRQVEAERRYGC